MMDKSTIREESAYDSGSANSDVPAVVDQGADHINGETVPPSSSSSPSSLSSSSTSSSTSLPDITLKLVLLVSACCQVVTLFGFMSDCSLDTPPPCVHVFNIYHPTFLEEECYDTTYLSTTCQELIYGPVWISLVRLYIAVTMIWIFRYQRHVSLSHRPDIVSPTDCDANDSGDDENGKDGFSDKSLIRKSTTADAATSADDNRREIEHPSGLFFLLAAIGLTFWSLWVILLKEDDETPTGYDEDGDISDLIEACSQFFLSSWMPIILFIIGMNAFTVYRIYDTTKRGEISPSIVTLSGSDTRAVVQATNEEFLDQTMNDLGRPLLPVNDNTDHEMKNANIVHVSHQTIVLAMITALVDFGFTFVFYPTRSIEGCLVTVVLPIVSAYSTNKQQQILRRRQGYAMNITTGRGCNHDQPCMLSLETAHNIMTMCLILVCSMPIILEIMSGRFPIDLDGGEYIVHFVYGIFLPISSLLAMYHQDSKTLSVVTVLDGIPLLLMEDTSIWAVIGLAVITQSVAVCMITRRILRLPRMFLVWMDNDKIMDRLFKVCLVFAFITALRPMVMTIAFWDQIFFTPQRVFAQFMGRSVVVYK